MKKVVNTPSYSAFKCHNMHYFLQQVGGALLCRMFNWFQVLGQNSTNIFLHVYKSFSLRDNLSICFKPSIWQNIFDIIYNRLSLSIRVCIYFRCCAFISELEHTYFSGGNNQSNLPRIQQEQAQHTGMDDRLVSYGFVW